MKSVTIHTDGACTGNPGPGGWAAVLQYGDNKKEISGGAIATTNNRMEMTAALESLLRLKEPCEVALYTDSSYLRDGMTKWMRAWKAKRWSKPIKNKDLWQALDTAAMRHKIVWHWVRGHNGNKFNERCDVLATGEAKKIADKHTAAELRAARAQFISQHLRSLPGEGNGLFEAEEPVGQ